MAVLYAESSASNEEINNFLLDKVKVIVRNANCQSMMEVDQTAARLDPQSEQASGRNVPEINMKTGV